MYKQVKNMPLIETQTKKNPAQILLGTSDSGTGDLDSVWRSGDHITLYKRMSGQQIQNKHRFVHFRM